MTAAPVTRIAQAGKYLAFELDLEEYGVEILRVREITAAAGLTPEPDLPACACGVIGLRGRTVPVVSLRQRLGLGAADHRDPAACVVVVDIVTPEGAMVVGLLVDRVTEVRQFEADAIGAPPGLGGGCEDGDWISGIAHGGERSVCLVDVDHLLNRGECAQLARTPGCAAVN